MDGCPSSPEGEGLLGEMAGGVIPNADPAGEAPAPRGITLREAMELHLVEMADNNKREISRQTLR